MKTLQKLKDLKQQLNPPSYKQSSSVEEKQLDVDKIIDIVNEAVILLQKIEYLFLELKDSIKGVKWYEFWKMGKVLQVIVNIVKNWDKISNE